MDATTDLTVFITKSGNELITDSRAVAIAFGKRHKNVLRTIDAMRASKHPEIATHYGLNFEPGSYPDEQGQMRPMYRMTSKGLSELTMSFSGDKSRVIRIRFLNAFEEVAQRLANAEKSITEMLLDLERKETPSKVKGQIGSKLMNERRKEKPEFAAQRAALESIAQPALPLH